jgi:hypothetical protein
MAAADSASEPAAERRGAAAGHDDAPASPCGPSPLSRLTLELLPAGLEHAYWGSGHARLYATVDRWALVMGGLNTLGLLWLRVLHMGHAPARRGLLAMLAHAAALAAVLALRPGAYMRRRDVHIAAQRVLRGACMMVRRAGGRNMDHGGRFFGGKGERGVRASPPLLHIARLAHAPPDHAANPNRSASSLSRRTASGATTSAAPSAPPTRAPPRRASAARCSASSSPSWCRPCSTACASAGPCRCTRPRARRSARRRAASRATCAATRCWRPARRGCAGACSTRSTRRSRWRAAGRGWWRRRGATWPCATAAQWRWPCPSPRSCRSSRRCAGRGLSALLSVWGWWGRGVGQTGRRSAHAEMACRGGGENQEEGPPPSCLLLCAIARARSSHPTATLLAPPYPPRPPFQLAVLYAVELRLKQAFLRARGARAKCNSLSGPGPAYLAAAAALLAALLVAEVAAALAPPYACAA